MGSGHDHDGFPNPRDRGVPPSAELIVQENEAGLETRFLNELTVGVVLLAGRSVDTCRLPTEPPST